MALQKSSIITLIKTKMNAAYGEPEEGFEDQLDKYADVLADIFIDILLTKLEITGTTNVIGGSSSGVHQTTIVKA